MCILLLILYRADQSKWSFYLYRFCCVFVTGDLIGLWWTFQFCDIIHDFKCLHFIWVCVVYNLCFIHMCIHMCILFKEKACHCLILVNNHVLCSFCFIYWKKSVYFVFIDKLKETVEKYMTKVKSFSHVRFLSFCIDINVILWSVYHQNICLGQKCYRVNLP